MSSTTHAWAVPGEVWDPHCGVNPDMCVCVVGPLLVQQSFLHPGAGRPIMVKIEIVIRIFQMLCYFLIHMPESHVSIKFRAARRPSGGIERTRYVHGFWPPSFLIPRHPSGEMNGWDGQRVTSSRGLSEEDAWTPAIIICRRPPGLLSQEKNPLLEARI